MPWIERVEVEDGFLDELNLELSPGLNVVIGARGTGKTSLLELIRFGLGGPAFTEHAAALSDAQVQAVLGRGRVTISIRDDDGELHSVSRTVGKAATPALQATVLAQNEIEGVGASASGRLHLVDRFLTSNYSAEIRRLQTSITAAGKTVDAGQAELRTFEQRAAELPTLEAELEALATAQRDAFERSSASDADRRRLEELQAGLQTSSLRHQVLEEVAASLERFDRRLQVTGDEAELPSWPAEAGSDPAADVRAMLATAVEHLEAARTVLSGADSSLNTALEAEAKALSIAEDESRTLRRKLGAVDAEVSSLSNQIAQLNERIGSLRALLERAADRRARLAEETGQRDELCSKLEELREDRFQARREIVERLNNELGGTIRVDLVQSADIDDYVNEIIDRLRGSGLHSSTLAPELAATFSPSDLLTLIEGDQADTAAASTGISVKRMVSALGRLRESGPSSLASAAIDDAVELFLLDGTNLKPSGQLSIGQRCTAVLPVLLQRHGDVLVIDQPEDHLDNAFVTSTLVESLRNRPEGDQVILASHNANVPVLGEADRVIHMDSDGRRGFVAYAGPLDDAQTVAAISDVMEGGADAFRRRAEFYELHGHVPSD